MLPDPLTSDLTILGARGEGDDRGWDGWMASLTRWMWVSVDSRSWWWTGRPGVLRFRGSKRVGHDWVTDLIWSDNIYPSSVQFSSVAQSCSTLCNPMNCSTTRLSVHHQLPEFTQTHIHRVSDAIQPSHPLSSPSPPAPNPSQHQSLLFQWVNSSYEVTLASGMLMDVMWIESLTVSVVWLGLLQSLPLSWEENVTVGTGPKMRRLVEQTWILLIAWSQGQLIPLTSPIEPQTYK